MKLEEQIKIVKELLEPVYELNELQNGWEDHLKKGREFLKYLKSKKKTTKEN